MSITPAQYGDKLRAAAARRRAERRAQVQAEDTMTDPQKKNLADARELAQRQAAAKKAKR